MNFPTPIKWMGVALCLFVLAEVNYPNTMPQTQLAVFAMLGLALVYLRYPSHARFKDSKIDKIVGYVLTGITILTFGYMVVQIEPVFESFWIGGQPLGNRAGQEGHLDHAVALIGLILVLEAARRAIGWTLPILSGLFILYAAFGSSMPDWLFPHRGYGWERIASHTFLQSQGVFSVALRVMFTYVFLFVIFGALLEKTGATGFIIDFARRLFRNSAGGPAKVAVISSGMMGSLSGSAVANTATTGTFTIPMMRSGGFRATVAAGIEAAASSGGALVPPVMGAGAYMMLEIVQPQVTFLEIIRAALLPAILYYVSLLLIVHFFARALAGGGKQKEEDIPPPPSRYKGLIFFGGFLALIAFLVYGYTPFRAVSLTLVVIVGLAMINKDTRLKFSDLFESLHKAAQSGTSLVAAAACVGIIVGVVTLTGVGAKLPSVILSLSEQNLLLALVLLMISTIILGMGLPSAVCYLLVATLIGPALTDLGVVPLAAHLFIFYFGMMSMVTPPVALAAYTAGVIAGSDIIKTGFAAFRFSLVGFALPFAFVIRPELLMLDASGSFAGIMPILGHFLLVLAGTIPLAAGVAGYAFGPLKGWQRGVLLVVSFTILLTRPTGFWAIMQGGALVVAAAIAFLNRRESLG